MIGKKEAVMHCAKHNQHTKHSTAEGSGAMTPQENFEKIDTLRLNSIAFQNKINVSSHIYN